jgi:hypothetical protein
MYIWRTSALSEDIKNGSLTDHDWKQYYLAGSIFVTISMYLIALSPRVNITSVLVESIAVIGVLIFGVSITYNTNQKGNGNGTNYIARITALSFPIFIKIFVLSLVFGIILGVVGEILLLSPEVVEWALATFSILVQIFYFWRLNVHLIFISQ